jgi:hypothetical protein
MTLKPVTPPDRTEMIKVLIGKWEKKNRTRQPVPPPGEHSGKPVPGKENKVG